MLHQESSHDNFWLLLSMETSSNARPTLLPGPHQPQEEQLPFRQCTPHPTPPSAPSPPLAVPPDFLRLQPGIGFPLSSCLHYCFSYSWEVVLYFVSLSQVRNKGLHGLVLELMAHLTYFSCLLAPRSRWVYRLSGRGTLSFPPVAATI